MSQGVIFDIQRYSLHDGPGIRTTVFMKGCPMACRWCQNPEGRDRRIAVRVFDNLCAHCGTCAKVCPCGAIRPDGSIDEGVCTCCGTCVKACDYNAIVFDGRLIDDTELLRELEADIPFYTASSGGVTFSGGEPLAQSEFVADVCESLQHRAIHTAVETALCVDWRDVEQLIPVVDSFIIDIKSVDPEWHRHGTAADGTIVLENFKRLAKRLKGTGKIWPRFTLVPGYSEETEAEKAAEFYASVDPDLKLELMNFNPLAAAKYKRLKVAEYEFYNCVSPYPQERIDAMIAHMCGKIKFVT